MKALCCDVKVEFSSSANNVRSLARVFEMDYQEVKRRAVIRRLSQVAAVEHILHSWPASRSNFLSKEGERSNKVLWQRWMQRCRLYALHILHTGVCKFVRVDAYV